MLTDIASLSERLRDHVTTLARAPRNPGSTQHAFASGYIFDVLRDAGWSPERRETHGPQGACINLLSMSPESPHAPILIVGAHYDTPPGVPGADDNASGVAALLELGRLLNGRMGDISVLRAAVQLVAYDREEDGLGGSISHVRELQSAGQNVGAMIALEMLGYAVSRPGSQASPGRLPIRLPAAGNFIAVCGNVASRQIAKKTAAGLAQIPGQLVETMIVPGVGFDLPEVRRSDHSAFWDNGYQALMITDTSLFRNPHYHRPTDTPDTLDYSFLAQVTLGLCLAVEALVTDGSNIAT